MFDKSKKIIKDIAPKKKDPTELIIQAKTELAMAKKKNESVIRMEKLQIQHYRDQRGSQNEGALASEELSVLKLKKAYYAILGIIDTEYKLADIYTTQMLYDAMNDYTNAMKHINAFKRKGKKPHMMSYEYQHKKLYGEDGSPNQKEVERIEKLYVDPEDIDEFVNDDVVNKLLNGESLSTCLNNKVGVTIPYDDFISNNFYENGGVAAENDGTWHFDPNI